MGFHSLASAKVPSKQVEGFLENCTVATSDGSTVRKRLVVHNVYEGNGKVNSFVFPFENIIMVDAND